MATATPGWRPDPYARASERWWDGNRFTGQIRNGDAESEDPLGDTATIPFTNPTGIVVRRKGFRGLWARIKSKLGGLFGR